MSAHPVPLLVAAWLTLGAAAAPDGPNLLLVTVDDMNADSVGAFGCPVAGTTPALDRLASEGLRFEHAHVQAANCMPSRNALWSGRYPHSSGVEGFHAVPRADYPVLADLMKEAGYFTAIRGKVKDSTPYHPYPWDLVLDVPGTARTHNRSPRSYAVAVEKGIAAAKKAGRPFCLMVNVTDPHKPFYGQDRDGNEVPDRHVPSRVFGPGDVEVPDFLPDDPVVRHELSGYYSSVRRADDCVRAILDALDRSGDRDRTVVMFLSDHGMPLPFVKSQLYHHSTRTPWIVRWPGVTEPGALDARHMISAVDMLPTLLDIVGVEHPADLEGRSFLPLLRGEEQTGRDRVIKEHNETAGGACQPMRALQTREYLYVFNPWSNGVRTFTTVTAKTPTFARMRELARSDDELAERLRRLEIRVVEELYDVREDPDCLRDLATHRESRVRLEELRSELLAWMVETDDPAQEALRRHDDPAVREAYVARAQAASDARQAEAADDEEAARD